MKNKVISLLCLILSIVFLFISLNASLNVLKGISTIGTFFSVIIATGILGFAFAIGAGFYAVKKSEKFKKITKKKALIAIMLSIAIVLISFILTIPNLMDRIIAGNIDKLITLHLILNVIIFLLGFITGLFLTRVINNNEVAIQINRNKNTKLQNGNIYRYILSFLIPLVGYILGAILLSKDNDDEKIIGRNCIVCGIISGILSVIISIIVFVL